MNRCRTTTTRARARGADGAAKATPIPPHWRPGERVFDWAAKHAMTRTWVEAQIDEFVVYWSDTGERRKSWDATFIKRLQTLQANAAKGQDHEPEHRLADKDYSERGNPARSDPLAPIHCRPLRNWPRSVGARRSGSPSTGAARPRRSSSGPSGAAVSRVASWTGPSPASRRQTPEQRQALAVCRDYAERFDEVRDRGSCLLLVGGPGTGKTHLACAILAEVIRAGHTGLFISVSAALRLIRDAYSPRAQRSESEAFALLTAPDLLVLDEVGVAIGNEAKRRAMLFDVLDTRYAEMRPSVLIGNLTVRRDGGLSGRADHGPAAGARLRHGALHLAEPPSGTARCLSTPATRSWPRPCQRRSTQTPETSPLRRRPQEPARRRVSSGSRSPRSGPTTATRDVPTTPRPTARRCRDPRVAGPPSTQPSAKSAIFRGYRPHSLCLASKTPEAWLDPGDPFYPRGILSAQLKRR